jgi:hypothetical protein
MIMDIADMKVIVGIAEHHRKRKLILSTGEVHTIKTHWQQRRDLPKYDCGPDGKLWEAK